ncbi:MAG: DUF3445 domain-containing protein [Halioglobus sp.]
MTATERLHDNSLPRYLPHVQHPDVLQMGLQPLQPSRWIEPDDDWVRYYSNKCAQRQSLGECVYRAPPASHAAQVELAGILREHLCTEYASLYRREGDGLIYLPEGERLPAPGHEPLWHCSLWVADDLVILQALDGHYALTAASLACPSAWRLEEKFGEPLASIHAPIPGFNRELTPRVTRFLNHLKPQQPVQRLNWSLQTTADLCQRVPRAPAEGADTPLFYRCERQTLRRLPGSGAIVFTIRVYVHPLDTLQAFEGAGAALFAAVEKTAPEMAQYKGFDRIAPALANYRRRWTVASQ